MLVVLLIGCGSSKQYLHRAYDYKVRAENLAEKGATAPVLLGYYVKAQSEALVALDKDPKYKEAYDFYLSNALLLAEKYDKENSFSYYEEALPYAIAYKRYYPDNLNASYYFVVMLNALPERAIEQRELLIQSGEYFLANSDDEVKKGKIKEIVNKYKAGAE